MSEYVDIGWAPNVEAVIDLKKTYVVGAQYDDITGYVSLSKHTWDTFSTVQQEKLMDTVKIFIDGWIAGRKR